MCGGTLWAFSICEECLRVRYRPLPIYGKGKNSREWIYVEDHCSGLLTICKKGLTGESYNIGTNINVNNLNYNENEN